MDLTHSLTSHDILLGSSSCWNGMQMLVWPVQGPLKALAVDTEGRNMVTAGADGQVRVWDLRMLRPRHAYFSRATPDRLDISQRGLLAVGAARSIQVWLLTMSTLIFAADISLTFLPERC